MFLKKKISIKRLPSIKYMKVVFTNYIYELFHCVNHNRFSVDLSFNLVWHTLIDSGNVIIFLDDLFVILFTYESSTMRYTFTFKTRICGIDKGNHNVPCPGCCCSALEYESKVRKIKKKVLNNFFTNLVIMGDSESAKIS